MIRLDPSLRLVIVGACFGLAVGAYQLTVLGSDARDMAYPGGAGEDRVTEPRSATIAALAAPGNAAVPKADVDESRRPPAIRR